MTRFWFHRTRLGTFYIRPVAGRFIVLFEDEDLGSYPHPQGAAEDVATGATFWPSIGDTSDLGIPDQLEDWQRA